jgi:hypothetical protein
MLFGRETISRTAEHAPMGVVMPYESAIRRRDPVGSESYRLKDRWDSVEDILHEEDLASTAGNGCWTPRWSLFHS